MVRRLAKRSGVSVLIAVLACGAAAEYVSTAQFAIQEAAETQDGFSDTDGDILEWVSIFVCSGYGAAAGYAFGFWPGVFVSGGCTVVMWA